VDTQTNNMRVLMGRLLTEGKIGPDAVRKLLAVMKDNHATGLAMSLEHPDAAVGLAALDVVSALDEPERFEWLCRALASSCATVGYLTAHRLAGYGEAAVAPLKAALPNSGEMEMLAIVGAFEKIDSADTVPCLMDALRTTDNAIVRYTTIRALSQLKARVAIELIRSFVDDPDAHVQSRARRAIEQFSREEVEQEWRQ